MIEIKQDPQNPERLIVTQTVTTFLDKILFKTLSDELEKAIAAQAKKDFTKKAVKEELSRLATKHLAKTLGIADEPEEEEPATAAPAAKE